MDILKTVHSISTDWRAIREGSGFEVPPQRSYQGPCPSSRCQDSGWCQGSHRQQCVHLPASVSPAEAENSLSLGPGAIWVATIMLGPASSLGPEVTVLSIRSQETLSLKCRIRLASKNPDQDVHPRPKLNHNQKPGDLRCPLWTSEAGD